MTSQQPTPTASPPRAPPALPPRKPRVMIVEDEALIALDIESHLLQVGYDVVGIVDDCDSALQLFQRTRPGLVLMDIRIRGDRDGIDTARAISQIADVPIVFLTAYADEATVARAAEHTPYGYLVKPFDERSLVAALVVAVRRHAADLQHRLLQVAVDAAPVGVLFVTCDGNERRISYANRAFQEMSQATEAEILGRTPCFLSADPHRPAVQRLREALRFKTAAAETIEGQRRDGNRFWAICSVSPVADRSGDVRRMLVMHLDITREREVQAGAMAAQRLELVGRLAAGVAHDFNNVLSSMMAFTELAREEVEDEEVREDLGEVLQAARRGAQLARRLLGFCRPTEPVPAERCDLVQTLATLRKTAIHLAGPTVQLELRAPPGPCFVPLDPTSVEQIFLNLVANARDAMPDGGRIDVELVERAPSDGGGVLLMVSDSGHGIEPDVLGRIFDPLFSTKPEGMGTGLGLWTSRTLVERAGGSLEVRSTTGQGSTFCIQLPTETRPGERPDADAVALPAGSGRGAICLLVDENDAFRRACGLALARAGFAVTEAASAAAAQRELDRVGPALALLICDLDLSGAGGSSLLSRLRDLAPRARLISMSAYGEDLPSRTPPGAVVLWKPFPTTALVRQAVDALAQDPEPPGGEQLPPRARPEPGPVVPLPQAPPPGAAGQRTVLVCSPDGAAAAALTAALSRRGVRGVVVADPEQARAAAGSPRFDLVVLDVDALGDRPDDLLDPVIETDPLRPTLALTGRLTAEAALRATRSCALGVLHKPVDGTGAAQAILRALAQGDVARLQRRQRAVTPAAAALLRDRPGLEARFEASLAALGARFVPIARAYDGSHYAWEAALGSAGPLATAAELVAAAEALGQMDALGLRFRQRVAEALEARPDRFEPVFVPLHPFEFLQPVLLRRDEPLRAHATRVVYGLSDEVRLGATTDPADTARALRAEGFRIAFDRVGTEPGGLSWLLRLSPDFVVIDPALTQDVDVSPDAREVLQSVIGLASQARALVMAAGVGTLGEAQVMRELGCDLLQGPFIAPPGTGLTPPASPPSLRR
jgi:PAS domain S-box-containing protein